MKTIALILMLASCFAFSKPRAKSPPQDWPALAIDNHSTNNVYIEVGGGDSSIGGMLPAGHGSGLALVWVDAYLDRQIIGDEGYILVVTDTEEVALRGIDWDFLEKWIWCSVEIFNNEDGSIAIGPIHKHAFKGKL